MRSHLLTTDQTQLGFWAVFANDRVPISEAFADRRTAEAIIPTLTPEEVDRRIREWEREQRERPSHLING